jgi:hypothetical protein
MTYAWSVECPLNDQGLVRLLVTAAGEAVVMCDSGESGSGRRTPAGSRLAIPAAPDWRVSPDLFVIPGTTGRAVTAAGRS